MVWDGLDVCLGDILFLERLRVVEDRVEGIGICDGLDGVFFSRFMECEMWVDGFSWKYLDVNLVSRL